MDTAETQVILSRFVKNAEDLNLPVCFSAVGSHF